LTTLNAGQQIVVREMTEHDSTNTPTTLISVSLASGSNDTPIVQPVYAGCSRLLLDLFMGDRLNMGRKKIYILIIALNLKY
jgi:hypothetical protein